MKLVLLSDTHDNHEQVRVPDGDVLIHAGDFTSRRDPHIGDTIQFFSWFENLPHPHKIVVAGNHDFLFQQQPILARSLIPSNVIYLEDTGVTIEGVNFWGSPYTPLWADWAFMEKGDVIQKHWDRIPQNTDVLITHGPPLAQYPDEMFDWSAPFQTHAGCANLMITLQQRPPTLHVCGHLHDGYGIYERGKHSRLVNAALCDNSNTLINQPIMVEI